MPARGEAEDHGALAGFAVGRVSGKGAGDAQEGQRPRPVARKVCHIQRFDGREGHAFGAHFLEQAGQAVGEVEECSTGSKVWLRFDQPGNKAREVEPVAQRRDGGGQVRADGVEREVGDEAQAREQARAGREAVAQAALHPAGVDEDRDTGERGGVGVARQEAARDIGGKVGAGGKGVEVSHGASPRPGGCCRAGRRRTIDRHSAGQRGCGARSSRPRAG